MKKTVVIISGFILTGLVSFKTPKQTPKQSPKIITIELTLEEAISLLNVVKTSESVSAQFATKFEQKINIAYSDAVKRDSLLLAKSKVDSTKKP